MANYDIGGVSVITGNPYCPTFDVGSASRIEANFIFTHLPNTAFFYWTAKNHMWYSQKAIYFLSEGSEQTQWDNGTLKPFQIMDLGDFKFGMYLWINDASVERGRAIDQIPYLTKYLTFCAYDDNGMYWKNAALNFLYDEDYSTGQFIAELVQAKCYIMVYDAPTGVYVVNAPTRIDTGILGRYYTYVPYYELTDGDYSNGRSLWYKLVDRNGVSIDPDDLDKEPDGSGTGGGDGDFDTDSDTISVPGLPGLSFCNSGLGTLYTPEISELREFRSWLYDPDVIETIARMWDSPMDLIVSLGIIPVTPAHTSAKRTVYIGGTRTGVDMTEVTNPYQELDCGTINIKEFYGSAVDYIGTRLSIYLPFIGFRELKTDEVMDGSVNVKYHIDIQNGSLMCYVTCVREKLNAVLYQFESNCYIQLPLMARDFSVLYQKIVKGAADTVMGGNPMSAVSGVASTAMNVMSSKPNVQKSGAIGATGGLMGIRKPYLILERPISAYPPNFKAYNGYPCNIELILGSLSGYTEVDTVLASQLTCTKEEQDAIISRLKEGVII